MVGFTNLKRLSERFIARWFLRRYCRFSHHLMSLNSVLILLHLQLMRVPLILLIVQLGLHLHLEYQIHLGLLDCPH
jgi:hypothetical protein